MSVSIVSRYRVSEDKSEKEVVSGAGVVRIFDCGSKIYGLSL